MKFVVDEEGLLKKVKKVAIKDRKIEIPNNVKEIGSSVFFAFKKIKEIIIPSSVEIIGEYAFQDCLNIENIILPSSIKSIERGAFYGCKKLTILAEATKKPVDWHELWKPKAVKVCWNRKRKG